MVENSNYVEPGSDDVDSNMRRSLDHTLEHFRAIVQGSDDAIISKTLDGIITSWNSGAQSVFGYTEFEMLGNPIAILIPPDRMAEEEYFLQKLKGGGRIDHFETERLHKNGHRINVSVTLSPIRDRAANVIGISKIARDTTRQMKLLASDQIARAVLQSSDDAIVTKSLSGLVTGWNPGATRMFGYTAEEMLGRRLDVLFPADRQTEEQFILERIAEGEHIDHFETVRLRKDGTPVHVSVSISPLRDNWGKIIGASKIARDITEKKHTEELLISLAHELEEKVIDRTRDLVATNAALTSANLELQRAHVELMRREKMSALGVLIAGVSHEMNTPLGNSLTVGSSLNDELAKFEMEVSTGKITKNRVMEFNHHLHVGLDLLLKNLARAIEQIIQFRQVSVDQSSEQKRYFDLKTIVADNLAVLQTQFKDTNHRIVVEVPDRLMMHSYPGAIGRIITQLVLNSLQHGFTDDMNGVVTIRAELQGDSHVQLICADNGKGIPAELLGRVFDPFFTTHMGQGSSGLGLNIVFNLATLTLAGTISVDSKVGDATTFSIVIPLNAC